MSVVTWKWGPQYPADFANRLRSAVARNLSVPHRVIVVTDDPKGLDPGIEAVPDRADHADMKAGSRSCYRRLRMFDHDFRAVVGDRFLHLDLDTVVVGSLDPLVDRPEDFVIWSQPQARIPLAHGYAYNPSMFLMRTGCYHELWARFHADPEKLRREASADRWFGTDMAILNAYLKTRKPSIYTEKDGVLSWWVHVRKERDDKWERTSKHRATLGDGSLPSGARVVHFHGSMAEGPNDRTMQEKYPWIKEHWR